MKTSKILSPELEEIFDSIESVLFSITVNLASDKYTFNKIVTHTDEWEKLNTIFPDATNISHSNNIFTDRIRKLSKIKTDERFEHPNDVAIATYILFLQQFSQQHFYQGMKAAQKAKNLWWTREAK